MHDYNGFGVLSPIHIFTQQFITGISGLGGMNSSLEKTA
jgi:hypothetical protein